MSKDFHQWWARTVVFLASLATSAFCAAFESSGIESDLAVVQSPTDENPLVVRVRMTILEGTQVYAGEEHFFRLAATDSEGLAEVAVERPATRLFSPSFSSDPPAPVYSGIASFTVTAPATGKPGEDWRLTLELRYQACTDTMCYPPESVRFRLSGVLGEEEWTLEEGKPGGGVAPAAQTPPHDGVPPDFRVTARGSGYMGKRQFLGLLAEGRGEVEAERGLAGVLQSGSVWLGVVLVLLGGLALNLTPCVLPMIPVNLAIIGAGAQASTRVRGGLLGGIYGLSMAFTYGLLGLIVVLGGGTFGAVNASPWFNFGIAVLFVVLAAAMLDLFEIDFSRFGARFDASRWQGGPVVLALVMGSVTAVLAGACVAPVVLAVLLVATREYAAGNPFGLLYPFVLGLGMGLPWPVAGSGIRFLPKPGTWMKYVKIAFALFFVGLAGYYALLGFRLTSGGEAVSAEQDDLWHVSLEGVFEEARETGKPVLIDFSTEWCKSCHAMRATTLADVEVREVLRTKFVPVEYVVEDVRGEGGEGIAQELDVMGFPTYVILDVAK